jgi:hypothetical protein
VVAEPTGGGPGEGIRTENGVMSLLVRGYVKDEIMGLTLDKFGEERYGASNQARNSATPDCGRGWQSTTAEHVASGIGFIGAGTIIFRREVVKGLTTAASIWAVAAVGLAVGGGMFLAAGSATLLALALLVLAKPLKARIRGILPTSRVRSSKKFDLKVDLLLYH